STPRYQSRASTADGAVTGVTGGRGGRGALTKELGNAAVSLGCRLTLAADRRALQKRPILQRPLTQLAHPPLCPFARFREPVLNARWHHGVNRALDEAELLQRPQRLREHLL